MEPFASSNFDMELSSRDRMLKLASFCKLEPLSVNCDHSRDNEQVDNARVLMICSSPLIDSPTYLNILQSNDVFPVVQRGMSYSVEVCGNQRVSDEFDGTFAPPNVNIFAPLNAIRRPVRYRIEPDENHLNGNPEYDIYNDIPNQDGLEFEYIRTPSVTSSRLSDYEDYNVLDSEPGYVHLDAVNAAAVPQPQVNASDFYLTYQDDGFTQEYIPPEAYPSEHSQVTNLTFHSSMQPTMRSVSYIQPETPITQSLTPQISDLVPGDTPILINMPIVYIIPMVPISIQPLFIAPIQPPNYTYLPAPLAFNCVLRTPFPQFIYSVEPCRSPGCPFSYRYRCPSPQLEQPAQRRRTTACQFQRNGRFGYQCCNRGRDEIEKDTPKRNSEEAPPPVRRLSDRFVTPLESTTTTTNTVEKITTILDSNKPNGSTTSIQKTSQIKVQISSRRDNMPKRKQFNRTNHSVEFRRSGREGIMRRYNQPRNMCFERSSERQKFNEIKLTAIRELDRDRGVFNCVDWLRRRDFSSIRRSFANSTCNNRPYFLNMYRNGPLPNVLQEVTVPVINNSVCENMYQAAGYIEHIPNIFICAGWRKGGFDSCEGDSGGPMVIQRPDKRWILAGIISWGIGCAEPNQPGVYTRISAFRDWINQILQF